MHCEYGLRIIGFAQHQTRCGVLCGLMTLGVNKDIQCHIYDHTLFSILANHQIRHMKLVVKCMRSCL